MSEQFPVTPHDRLSPDGSKERMHDIAKAQLVARAMTTYESESAAVRFVTERSMTMPYGVENEDGGDYEANGISFHYTEEALKDDPLSKVHNVAGALHELRHTGTINSANNGVSHEIADIVISNNTRADVAARIVANAYDQLEATKR